MEEDYNKALEDVHGIVADWYDEELEINPIRAKANYSRTIKILKKRIDELFKKSN